MLRVYDGGNPDAPIFYACQAGRCKGGEKFECSPGYTGNLCSECAKGQFYWSGGCGTSCADIEPQGVVTAFGIIAVVIVWLVLNKSAGGQYALRLQQQVHMRGTCCMHGTRCAGTNAWMSAFLTYKSWPRFLHSAHSIWSTAATITPSSLFAEAILMTKRFVRPLASVQVKFCCFDVFPPLWGHYKPKRGLCLSFVYNGDGCVEVRARLAIEMFPCPS